MSTPKPQKIRPYFSRPELDYLISLLSSTSPSPESMKVHVEIQMNLQKLQFADQIKFGGLSLPNNPTSPTHIPPISEEEKEKGLSDLSALFFSANPSDKE